MIYVVNVDFEVEAKTPELAEDLVLANIETMDSDVYATVLEVKELEAV